MKKPIENEEKRLISDTPGGELIIDESLVEDGQVRSPHRVAAGELIIDESLVEDGQVVVLGLSGGPDSVCLLYELKALDAVRRQAGGKGNKIVCAHINHGLRGEEADDDEEFVVSLAKKFGMGFYIKRIDAEELASESGMTVEEAGREARYAFFDEVCVSEEKKLYEPSPFGMARFDFAPDPLIAVAHNLDDQVETVLMRILRGTGMDGLAGMSARRKSAAGFDIVRLLLGVPRSGIEERLEIWGAEARTDESNLKTDYLRNKLRLEVLPWLEDNVWPGIRQSLSRLAENAAEDKAYFDAVITETLEECIADAADETISIPAEVLAETHPAIRHRLIRAAFSELGLKQDVAAVHLAAADRLLKTWQDGGEASGKRVEFPCDYTFGIKGKTALFRTPSAADPSWKPMRKL